MYLHVVQGLAAAGGGVEKTLQEQSEEVRSALRIIYTTRSFPSHPVAAHPRVPKDIREKVSRALLSMNNESEGRARLKNVPVEQLIPVKYDDYAVMSSWGIEKYWQPVSGD
ncbi:Periplasmic binding protein-related protein (fragment) [Candidatus Sulfobium mesophilum]|uniref:Periplasmic binding protein-related protein n=1 Tax=Candidatus Sulfobium mesophilum TaxID=2016548 RepID=A0A2U3QE90_9BACT